MKNRKTLKVDFLVQIHGCLRQDIGLLPWSSTNCRFFLLGTAGGKAEAKSVAVDNASSAVKETQSTEINCLRLLDFNTNPYTTSECLKILIVSFDDVSVHFKTIQFWEASHCMQAIILSPTRELAVQSAKVPKVYHAGFCVPRVI